MNHHISNLTSFQPTSERNAELIYRVFKMIMIKRTTIKLWLLLAVIFSLLQINAKAQLLAVSGKKIINTSSNQEVILNSINFGNWMVMEGYMMNSSNQAPDQHTWKQKLTTLIGSANTTTFYMRGLPIMLHKPTSIKLRYGDLIRFGCRFTMNILLMPVLRMYGMIRDLHFWIMLFPGVLLPEYM